MLLHAEENTMYYVALATAPETPVFAGHSSKATAVRRTLTYTGASGRHNAYRLVGLKVYELKTPKFYVLEGQVRAPAGVKLVEDWT
jgi:hypothetical protein